MQFTRSLILPILILTTSCQKERASEEAIACVREVVYELELDMKECRNLSQESQRHCRQDMQSLFAIRIALCKQIDYPANKTNP